MMIRRLSLFVASLALVVMTACSESNGPTPPPPQPILTAPTPKALLMVTHNGSSQASYYWGTIINDVVPPQSSAPTATTDTPNQNANATIPSTAAGTSGASRPTDNSLGAPDRGTPAPAAPVQPTAATTVKEENVVAIPSAVGNYRADAPLTFRFKDSENRTRLGVTAFGEVVFKTGNTGLPRITVWNPAKSIAEEVTWLQNRPGSTKGIYYDSLNDQLVFVQTKADGKNALLVRSADGKETELGTVVNLSGIIQAGDGHAVVTDTPNKIRLANLKAKTLQDFCADCTLLGFSSDPLFPALLTKAIKDGSFKLTNVVSSKSWNLTGPSDGKNNAIAFLTGFLTTSNEPLYLRATTPLDGSAATGELIVLDQSTGTPRTLAAWKELTAADLKTGPKFFTVYPTAVAHQGDKYLLYGEDQRCEQFGPGKLCSTVSTHYEWLGTDGKIQPIAKYDWATKFVGYSAKSNRLLIESQDDVSHLIALDAATGKELAKLDRMASPQVAAYGKPTGANWSWENREFLLTLHQTDKENEYEVGVLSQYLVDTLTDGVKLTPAVIGTVQGLPSITASYKDVYAIDWKAGLARPAAIVADATPTPEGSKPVTTPDCAANPALCVQPGGNQLPSIVAPVQSEIPVKKTGNVTVTQYLKITDPENDPIYASMSCPGAPGSIGVGVVGNPSVVEDKSVAGSTHRSSITFDVTDLALVDGAEIHCQFEVVDEPQNQPADAGNHTTLIAHITFVFKKSAAANDGVVAIDGFPVMTLTSLPKSPLTIPGLVATASKGIAEITLESCPQDVTWSINPSLKSGATQHTFALTINVGSSNFGCTLVLKSTSGATAKRGFNVLIAAPSGAGTVLAQGEDAQPTMIATVNFDLTKPISMIAAPTMNGANATVDCSKATAASPDFYVPPLVTISDPDGIKGIDVTECTSKHATWVQKPVIVGATDVKTTKGQYHLMIFYKNLPSGAPADGSIETCNLAVTDNLGFVRKKPLTLFWKCGGTVPPPPPPAVSQGNATIMPANFSAFDKGLYLVPEFGGVYEVSIATLDADGKLLTNVTPAYQPRFTVKDTSDIKSVKIDCTNPIADGSWANFPLALQNDGKTYQMHLGYNICTTNACKQKYQGKWPESYLPKGSNTSCNIVVENIKGGVTKQPLTFAWQPAPAVWIAK